MCKIGPRVTRRLLLSVVIGLTVFYSVDVFAQQSKKTPSRELSVEERVEAEQRLWDLGYWAGSVDEKFDSDSRHALIAFQKVERRQRTGKLTIDELNALRAATRPLPRYSHYAHVEIDLARQVLFVIDETGAVARILPVSTGNEQLYTDKGRIQRAHTPTGTFKVLRKINGWRRSSLGLMYYPNYIINGIAIHGSSSIPTKPASHGCIRVPLFAAKELSSLLPIGIEVLIYNSQQPQKASMRLVNEQRRVGQ